MGGCLYSISPSYEYSKFLQKSSNDKTQKIGNKNSKEKIIQEITIHLSYIQLITKIQLNYMGI